MNRRRPHAVALFVGCLLCILLPRQCRKAKTAEPLEPTRFPSSAIVSVTPVPRRVR